MEFTTRASSDVALTPNSTKVPYGVHYPRKFTRGAHPERPQMVPDRVHYPRKFIRGAHPERPQKYQVEFTTRPSSNVALTPTERETERG